jgi:hypothetical protein
LGRENTVFSHPTPEKQEKSALLIGYGIFGIFFTKARTTASFAVFLN